MTQQRGERHDRAGDFGAMLLPQLSQRLFLDLADALAGDAETPAYLI